MSGNKKTLKGKYLTWKPGVELHSDKTINPGGKTMKYPPKKILLSILAIAFLVVAAASIYFGKLTPSNAIAEEKTNVTGVKEKSSKLVDSPAVSSLLNKMSMQVALEHPMMPDFELLDLDGNKVRLSQFRGETVLLGFFTTW
jgi:cytochrome oxidase Cu insertion factor (SCO1/SenC/PrrC family)